MMQSTEKSKRKSSLLKKQMEISSYKNNRNKIVFGSVLTLHTFGRDLKWNPHTHCLVCEEALDTKKNKMKNFSFISCEKLRKT
ncbi:transposase [Faecalibacillus intestinalis]|uniref:transposase n=1 Tax=Faecalibacillus intestinalis TaxID=1982626 RepID=UPI000E3E3855